MLGAKEIEQRLALLKQQERELQLSSYQSHASLAETQELEAKLTAIAAEIADLESVISHPPMARSA